MLRPLVIAVPSNLKELTGITEGRRVPVRLQCHVQLMHASALTLNVVSTDLASAFSSARSILFHSPLLQLASRVAIQRALGESEVHCLRSETGGHMTGTLTSALRWELHRQGWVEIWYIQKVRHTMVHGAEYEGLLAQTVSHLYGY